LAPLLPITLTGARSISVLGLLDTGATVNVLPYAVGEPLGAIWEKQSTSVRLTGNLAACEARALIVSAVIGELPEVRLAFACARTDDLPILLGQVNFFMESDVCFHRSRSMFEVRPKHSAHSPG
jgi:hypothetical protein